MTDNQEMATAEGSTEGDPSTSDGHSIDHRRERVRFETEHHRVEGVMTLARDGFRSRVSDVLNASERDFVTLTDVTVTPHDGTPAERHRYLTVARRHIVFAVSTDGADRDAPDADFEADGG
jgi:hypothetical protein